MEEQNEITLEVVETTKVSLASGSLHMEMPDAHFTTLSLNEESKAELRWKGEIFETAPLPGSDWLKIRDSGYFIPEMPNLPTFVLSQSTVAGAGAGPLADKSIALFPKKYDENLLALVVISATKDPKIYGARANQLSRVSKLNDCRIHLEWDFSDQFLPEKIAIETTHLYDGEFGCMPRLTRNQEYACLESSGNSKVIISDPSVLGGILISIPPFQKASEESCENKIIHIVVYSLNRSPRGGIFFHQHASI